MEGRFFCLWTMLAATRHPPDVCDKYSNITIAFLPANTTSVLQPLDLGIIKSFKVHYRMLLMRFVLAKIDECSCASEGLKSMTVLQAIRWVSEAWKNVKETTIKKCFRKAGMLRKDDFSIVRPGIAPDDDPFADIDEQGGTDQLASLIQQVQGDDACTALEFILEEEMIPLLTLMNKVVLIN